MNPLVTVTIPTHNRASLLGRALRSVLAQTFEDWECLVVDDASTDDTEEVVRAFGDRRIHYLRHDTNQGGSAARNTGMREARGKYLAFLDSDDEWLPKKLEKQLGVFQTTELREVVLVSCGRTYVWPGERERTIIPFRQGWFRADMLAGRPGDIDSTGTFLLKRLKEDFPPSFDETLPALQDLEFLMRVSEYGQVDYVPEALLIRHMHVGEHVHSSRNVYEARKLIAEKHFQALRTNRRQLAFLYQRIAASAGLFGERRECVWYLARAMREWPWNVGNYPRLAAAAIGAWPRSDSRRD